MERLWLNKFHQKMSQAWQLVRPEKLMLPPPGLHHYQHFAAGERSRIHLRVDADLSGILIVNANRVLHLNPTAALMAYLSLQDWPVKRAVRLISSQFRVPNSRAHLDYMDFINTLDELIRPDGACPVHDLDLEVTAPFSSTPSAPYRMDLALTYRCNNNCDHCYNARPRSFPELSTETWLRIIDRLWQQGIPHIVFTGGEPTLRDDLPILIAHAEKNGQITGINTNGRRLSNPNYVQELAAAGLDHVQITFESHDPAIHDSMVAASGAWEQTTQGIRNVLNTNLYVMTNTTMLQDNSPSLKETLNFLASLGVPTIGLNALIYSGKGRTVGKGLPEQVLPPLLEIARSATQIHDQRLIWYTPTQYCHFDPVEMELGVKGCTAARYNMCIEPNGDVIPCQSYYQPLGNILADSWESIWNHSLAQHLREHRYAPEKCRSCSFLSECGAGCPLALEHSQTIPELPVIPVQIHS